MPDLTTLAAEKIYLGIASGDTSQDALLASLISAASQAFLNAIGRPLDFAAANYTERFCVAMPCKIYLNHWPVNSIASVTLNEVALPVWDSNNPSVTGYIFDATPPSENKTGLLIHGDCWPGSYWDRQMWKQNAVVIYNAGYSTIPDDVAEAVREWVGIRRGVAQIQSVTQTNESVTLGDYSQGAGNSSSSASYSNSAPDSVQLIMDLYKKPRI